MCSPNPQVVDTTTKAVGLFQVKDYVYSWNGLSSFDVAPEDTDYTLHVSTVALGGGGDWDGSGKSRGCALACGMYRAPYLH